jgi:hypothetical protein
MFRHSDALIQLYYNIQPRGLKLAQQLEADGYEPDHEEKSYYTLRFPYDRPSYLTNRARSDAERLAHMCFLGLDLMAIEGATSTSASTVAVHSVFTPYMQIRGSEVILLDEIKMPKEFTGSTLSTSLIESITSHHNPRALMNRIDESWSAVRVAVNLKDELERTVQSAVGQPLWKVWSETAALCEASRTEFNSADQVVRDLDGFLRR